MSMGKRVKLTTENMRIIVQASSRSWSGGPDLCMEIVDGLPIICHTLSRIINALPEALITIAAPYFDKGGKFDGVVKDFNNSKLSVYYGHDASPLNRMIEITNGFKDEDYIIRVNGINFCVDLNISKNMLKLAQKHNLDCVKLPDDFPVIFTSDIYKIGALRRLEKLLSEDNQNMYKAHPKYFMFYKNDLFNTAHFQELPKYGDDYLYDCRKIGKKIYNKPRQDITLQRVACCDLLAYHYDIAVKYISTNDAILDIASGSGFGSALIASKMPTASVVAADQDPFIIQEGEKRFGDIKNLSFCVQDVTTINFRDSSFDTVLSMETMEHIEDDHKYCSEISRVLKSNGRLIISTPQNSIGHIPINGSHIREYSLIQLQNLLQKYFIIDEVIGIKQGCISFLGDPTGTNTIVVCRNK